MTLAELYAASGLGSIAAAEKRLIGLGLVQWGLAMRAFCNRGNVHA